jgi:3-hydroxyisobutyrate dehydrogenase
VGNDMTIKPKIGFIGIGKMGSRMCVRLLEAGYSVSVYARSREKAGDLEKKGAGWAESPRKLASDCQVLMTSVSDDKAIEAVMFGETGALAGAGPGKVFIDLSTIYPATSQKISEAARELGVSMLDAPVSGSTPQAEQGTLLVMIGGNPKIFEQHQALLSHLGKEVVYIGPSGAGLYMKLAINTLLGIGVQALAEALALGQKAGLDRELLLKVIGSTAVVSPSQKAKLESARKREYPPTFPTRLMQKDFGLVMRLAEECSVPMPAAAAAFQMYSAQKVKDGELDFGAVIRLMEELSGVSGR